MSHARPLVIGKIWDSEYPWDVRVEKVCGALIDAGHRIELVCRNRRNQPTLETHPGLRIHRMPYWRRLGRLERWATFPAFFNPRWYRLARQAFAGAGVDLILCRDLPLAPLALAVGRSLRRPVVLDIAEHYPGLLRDLYNPHDFRPVNLLVRNPWLASLVERSSLPRADHVLVVVEESAERLVRLGVAADRLTVVSNTPLLRRVRAMPVADPPRATEALRLVYLGKVERSRGLSTVVEGLRHARHSLDVFGEGDYFEQLRRETAALGLDGRVRFHGHRPYEQVLAQLPGFDVGVIPHHATDHWNYTIQNKLFDYMSAQIPVIVSSMPPAARIVRQSACGEVFTDRDPAAFVEAAARLLDPGVRRTAGEAGRRAIETTYHWERDAARLVQAIESVGTGAPAG
jgi:glycosyltransferase involved in cell wall biosynthesis